MTRHFGTNVRCRLVAEYVDEAEMPATAHHQGEPVLPSTVIEYNDFWSKDEADKEFTVLLRDGRVVTVPGHNLQYIQSTANASDCGSYAILARAAEGEITVALFRVGEVTGIFANGAIRVPGDSLLVPQGKMS